MKLFVNACFIYTEMTILSFPNRREFIRLSYRRRLAFLVALDSLIVLTAIYISFWILHPELDLLKNKTLLISSITLLLSHHLFASIYRLYNKAWEYASVDELVAIFKAVTFSIVTTAIIQYVVSSGIYMRTLVITWMLHMLLIGGSRFVWRVYRDHYLKPNKNKKRTLIIGAGAAGTMVARQMLNNPEGELKPVAFIDDDVKKHRLDFYGIPVVGDVHKIKESVEKYSVEQIIIAIPSLSKKEIQRIFDACAETKVMTKIVPKLEDIITGKVSVNQFRNVEVEDLLGREPIELDMASISKKLTGKTVLVTGAGGSIGSEICRQVCEFSPEKIVLVGHGENSIYQIHMELQNKYKDSIEIVPVIGDVQDHERMFEVVDKNRPHVIYHAAAHKHVPLMEYNPREAVKNNVFGTKNMAEAADTFGVKNFVLISTDKAVNPPNVMGATKRVAEMVIQSMAQKSETKFVAVRFGNVLGSRGSVIPLFKKQIQAGGPVTVTHPEITRYFMTIPEASRLVLQAGALAKGGEIFVLDMGEPVKIVDLAKNLIQLSGYTIDEIGIEFTGLRPGEKMYEELLNENEIHPEQIYPKIYIGKASVQDVSMVIDMIEKVQDDSEKLKEYLVEVANVKQEKELVLSNIH